MEDPNQLRRKMIKKLIWLGASRQKTKINQVHLLCQPLPHHRKPLKFLLPLEILDPHPLLMDQIIALIQAVTHHITMLSPMDTVNLLGQDNTDTDHLWALDMGLPLGKQAQIKVQALILLVMDTNHTLLQEVQLITMDPVGQMDHLAHQRQAMDQRRVPMQADQHRAKMG